MRIAFGLALVCAACIAACGGGSNGGSSGGGGADGKAGESSGGSGNSGNNGDAGDGNGGDAGGTGLPPVVSVAKPHQAGGLVAGGVVGHSKNFTGVFSLGAAPAGNGVLTSKTHQLRGGVIGASQR